jgi:hypothetical protein
MSAILRRAVAKGGGELHGLWLKATKATANHIEIVSFVALSGRDCAVGSLLKSGRCGCAGK